MVSIKRKPFDDITEGWNLWYAKYAKTYVLSTPNILTNKPKIIKVVLDSDTQQYLPVTFDIDIINVTFGLKDEGKTYYEQPNC